MPTTSGYSRKPLRAKLGIKPDHRILVLNAPQPYKDLLGESIQPYATTLSAITDVDFIHLFARHRADLEQDFGKAKERLRPDGLLWVSWPKKASGVASDLDENIVRAAGLSLGLVDVKVAAIDDIWSGLKFVFRLKDRQS
ncbi:MAG: DUF3052 domain-containing protein [Chloroflexi bacterium]|nr:DUF3052 domain-containing protein [Chloroflexota bacterium]